MNPIKSVIARKQNKIANNFENSKYGKKLRKLKNTHCGEKCFVIGNGPSLSENDLSVLKEKNIQTFCANRIFKIFDKTDWRPTYYVCEDEFILEDIWKSINQINLGQKFIPIYAKWYNDIKVNDAIYYLQKFNKDEAKAVEKSNLFSESIDKYIVTRSSVTMTCIQIAIYMRFDEIYLLGVDHNFSHMVDKNGNMIVDDNVKDHFGNQKNGTSETKGIFNVDAVTQAFMDVKAFAKSKNVKIYNATRGGKLEVFPRVDFDSIFK